MGSRQRWRAPCDRPIRHRGRTFTAGSRRPHPPPRLRTRVEGLGCGVDVVREPIVNAIQKQRTLLRTAAGKNPTAALKLARSYGFDRPKDFHQEVKWYRRAAELGNLEAQNLLGECYRDGHGVRRNLKQGIKLLSLAAKRGEPYVGVCFHDGLGVKRDFKKAAKHYRRALKEDPY